LEPGFTTVGSSYETDQKKKLRWMHKNYTFTNPYNYASNDFLALSLTGVYTSGKVRTENSL
jgi:hypothetical protein